MTGTQMAIELRKLNPTLPIVIASGYGGAGFETRAISAGVNRVLQEALPHERHRRGARHRC